MRYLKTFKVFEANAPIEPGNKSWRISAFMKDASLPHDMQLDIHDMSYELRDEGYSISYQWWPPYDKDSKYYQRNKYPSISITKRIEADDESSSDILEEISYVDIKDFCERVSSYLDEVGYNVSIKWRKENLANLGGDFIGSVSKNEYDLKNSKDKDGVFSKYFKIDMISKDVYRDVNESTENFLN